MSSGGGKGGGGGSKQYDYHGTIAATWCVGQTDKLTGVIVDDRRLWTGPLLRSESTNPIQVSIPGRGIYHHYWGTRDQHTVNPLLQASGNNLGHEHPSRNGICYGIFEDFLFGRERVQAPSISIQAERAPLQTLIAGAPTLLVDSQANPFCVLAEAFLDDWFGLGLPLSLFAAPAWQAAAELALLKEKLCYVSPFLTGQTSARAFAADLFTLCDGFLRSEAGTGLCEAGMFTAPEEIVVASLSVVSQSMRLSNAKPKPGTWDDVENIWNVSFRDRNFNFKGNAIRHDNPASIDRAQEDHEVNLQRPSIVRSEQAWAHAREWDRRTSTPGLTGTQAVRPETILELRPGEHARIDVQAEPGGAPDLRVCRVMGIHRSAKDGAEIEYEAVRSLAPVLYTPGVPPPEPPPPEIPCIAAARLFSPPSELTGSSSQLVVLAARPAAEVTDFALLFSTAEAGPFDQLGIDRSYAVRGSLAVNQVSSSMTPLSVQLLDTLDRELFALDPGDSAAANDSVLMIIFKIVDGQIDVAPDGNAYFEIFSVSQFAASAPDTIEVTFLRGRRGTIQRSFIIGSEVWFIRRENLAEFSHAEFATLATNQDLGYFDLQPGTISDRKEGCDVIPFQFPVSANGAKPKDFSDLFYFADGVSLELRERAATVSFVGHLEHFNPSGFSSPRKRYRVGTQSGVYNFTGEIGPPCITLYRFTIGGTDTYDAVTGVRTPACWRQFECGADPNDGWLETDEPILEGPPWFTITYTETRTKTTISNGSSGQWANTGLMELTQEDTLEDAFERSYPPGATDDSYGLWDGDISSTIAHWQSRGDTNSSFSHKDVQFRPVATGLEPDAFYSLKVTFGRRTYNMDAPDWVEWSTMYFEISVTEAGAVDEGSIIEIPNEEGFYTRIDSFELIKL